MTRRIYLAPIVTLTIGDRRPLASKVLEYGRLPNISSVLSRNKIWALTSCDFDDAQHNLVSADPEIVTIPGSRLNDTWNDFTTGQRTAIGDRLETLRVPLDWIQSTTTVADLLRHAARVALLGQMLKTDALDDVSLDSTFGSLPAARRNRILDWANANGVDTTGLSGSTTIRALLRALVMRFPWNITHELPFMRAAQSQVSITARLLMRDLRAGKIGWDDPRLRNAVAQVTVSDNFDRANSTSIGANWSEDTGDWEIFSNILRHVTTGGFDYWKAGWVGAALASADYYVQATIVATTNSGLGVGVGGRLAAGTGDANSDGYDYHFFGGDAAYLLEHLNSGEAILDTGAAVASGATITNARLTCNGSALSGNRNGGADDVNATDATYASGSVGCWWFGNSNFGGSLNDWTAADLAAAAASLLLNRPIKRSGIYVR